MGYKALVVCDVDGSLCDGVYYFDNGQRARKWNLQDGHAFQLLKENNILPIMLSGEDDENIRGRAEKLGVSFFSSQNKLEFVLNFLEQMAADPEIIVGVFGDDVNDLPLMQWANLVSCPLDAVSEVRYHVSQRMIDDAGLPCNRRSGKGAFREFVDWFLLKF